MLWPFFGDLGKTPDRVKPADVLAWVHGIGKSGRTPSATTVGARIACLSSYFRFLIRMGLVVGNPCDAVERPRSVQSVARGYGAGGDRVDAASKAVPRRTAGVPPRGFEPLISTLKGSCPRPLDDGGRRDPEFTRGAGRGSRPRGARRRACRANGGQPTRTKIMIRVPAMDNAQITAETPPSSAKRRARPASSLWPAP